MGGPRLRAQQAPRLEDAAVSRKGALIERAVCRPTTRLEPESGHNPPFTKELYTTATYCLQKTVDVDVVHQDQYDQSVCRIFVNGVDVNKVQDRCSEAWPGGISVI